MNLFLDFETASEADLEKVGLYNYAQHSTTRPLMLAWAFNKRIVRLWEPHKEAMPAELAEGLRNPEVTKIAFNVPFERHHFLTCLKIDIPYEQWMDVMVLCRYMSIPGPLKMVCEILQLTEDVAKMDGGSLIDLFCSPFRAGGKTTLFGVTEPKFHNWEDRPEDWRKFGEYCKRDVEVERKIFYMFQDFMLPLQEHKAWCLDQKINDRGVPVNVPFVRNALAMAERSQMEIKAAFCTLTELENPNSQPQLLPWLQQRGYPFKSLNKDFVAKALSDPNGQMTFECKKALVYRRETARTSFTKFHQILAKVSPDGRIRGLFSFMGAARTGRWSGKGGQKKGVQFQNLPRPDKAIEKKLDRAMELITANDYDTAIKEFITINPNINEKVPSLILMITSCIRAVFQAPEGKKLLVCDLGAIENRAIGWLADCDAIAKVFREKKDPYIDFATRMYQRSYAELLHDKEKRQIAKPAVLGAGYGLGHGTEYVNNTRIPLLKADRWGNMNKTGLIAYAENMGVKLTPEESYAAVTAFRKAYPEVCAFPKKNHPEIKPGIWWKLEHAATEVIKNGGTKTAGHCDFSRKKLDNGWNVLRIMLPSGRYLHYMNVRIEIRLVERKGGLKDQCDVCKDLEEPVSDHEHSYEKDSIVYDGVGHGVGATTTKVEWASTFTYGAKYLENLSQSWSRDVLVYGMFKAEEMGGEIVAHVHDELICETDEDEGFGFSGRDLKHAMESIPPWAPNLLLAAEGYETKYYKKN